MHSARKGPTSCPTSSSDYFLFLSFFGEKCVAVIKSIQSGANADFAQQNGTLLGLLLKIIAFNYSAWCLIVQYTLRTHFQDLMREKTRPIYNMKWAPHCPLHVHTSLCARTHYYPEPVLRKIYCSRHSILQ